MEILIQLILLVVGFVMLMKGADWFVEGASRLADKFGIPQLVIGLTIVAMGTSLPEAAVSISAAVKGSADIAIGNVVGSNIMNVLVILGLTAIFCAIPVQSSTAHIEIPFVILITLLLGGIGYFDETVGRADGVILWAGMLIYLGYLLYMAKHGQPLTEEETEEKEIPVWLMCVMILGGGAMIIFGSDITVDAAKALAKFFGMDDRLIGLTIVAFGTSLPELVTSVTAGMKKKPDIAVGNIVGSNIFNILFVIGTTALIIPVPYAKSFAVDTVVAIATVVLLFIFVLPKKRLTRPAGIVMLIAYAGYFAYLLQTNA